MAKDKLTDYDSTASGNLDVGGISVAEGMLPSGVNNAIRELMSHQADAFGAGTPLYVDQTNNRLGVGTTSPSTYGGKLSITDGSVGGETTLVVANNNANQFIRMGINADVAQIAYDNADSLAFGIATDSTTSGLTTEHMRIDSSGNVGIGTSSPDNRLHVNSGTTNIAALFESTDTIAFIDIKDSNTTNNVQVGADGDDFVARTSGTERMRISSGGNVGIGTSSPFDVLHVEGTIRSNISDAADENLRLTTDGGGGFVVDVDDATISNPTWSIRTFSGEPLAFEVGGAERMRVSADGEVTKPDQPSFMVSKSSDQTLVVGSGANTITWQNEIWDIGGNFASNTFTAPVTGKYYLQAQMRIDQLDTAATYYVLQIVTSNRTKQVIIDPNFSSDLLYYNLNLGSVFDMDAGDVAYVSVLQISGTASHVDDGQSYTSFSGYLLG